MYFIYHARAYSTNDDDDDDASLPRTTCGDRTSAFITYIIMCV